MTKKRILILSTLILLSLLFGLAGTQPARAALSLVTISPNLVVNDIPSTITINGTDFVAGAQVKVGATEVTTTFVSDTSLTAIIPPGFTPGIYTVEVINPDTSSVSIPAGLTVVAPTPMPTMTEPPFSRPQVMVGGYSTDASGGIRYGKEFTLTVRLVNSGAARAYGLQVTFSSIELQMLRNGGVVAVGNLNSGSAVDIAQVMTAANPFYGISSTTMEMNISYYDEKGTAYSEKFSLVLGVYNTYSGVKAATATPTGVHQSQLIVSKYQTDLDILQPGLTFTIDMTIQNKGDLPAKSVTLIVGGGSTSSGGGTPGPGGISGSSGDFTNFAPVGSSNVQSLGEIAAGASLAAKQTLIVNVNTAPGAYPMKVTLSYTDSHGVLVNDEQVITLLVYRLPIIDVSFYQPVFDMYTYQSNLLPLQIINLGKQYMVLGNIKVTSSSGMVENGSTFIGGLDTGGYFTLDAMFTPETAGEAEVVVTIEYMDDFSQTRSISKTLQVNVVEMMVDPSLDPNNPDFNGGEVIVEQPETIWQKIWRFILGLFGLDSSTPPIDSGQPIEVMPGEIKPIPMPSNGGKG